MKKHYVSLEMAKTLKEKGYKEINNYWYEYNPVHEGVVCKGFDENDSICIAPELHEVQQWLREEHGIEIVIGIDVDFTWRDEDEDLTGESIAKVTYYTYDACICNKWLITNAINSDDKRYATYEEALEEGINEVLKMI